MATDGVKSDIFGVYKRKDDPGLEINPECQTPREFAGEFVSFEPRIAAIFPKDFFLFKSLEF